MPAPSPHPHAPICVGLPLSGVMTEAATAAEALITTPTGCRARRAPILPAIAIALAAFAWLNHVNPPFPITDDAVRDQLLARDCTDLGHCHLIGASTSVRGFHQGAVWLDLLIAVRLLGGDTASQRTVVLALLALSVATLFLVAWHWLRPSIALPAAVLLTAALSVEPYASLLINPSAAAFPDVIAAAGLLCYGLSGRRRFLVVAAFALGVGINVHIGSLSLMVPLVALAALTRPRPWRALLAALAVLFVTYFLTSRAALLANLIGLARHGRLMPALAGGVAVVLLSAALGSRFRRLSWEARAWGIGLMLVLPFGLGSLWLVFAQRHGFGVTYWHPILGPAAALAAALVALPFELAARWFRALRWIPTAAALAGLALVAVHVEHPGLPPALAEPWTLAEASVIADRATQRGWSYENLVFHIQSKACRDLLVAMSITAPPPRQVPARGRRQLQVVKVSGGKVAAKLAGLAAMDGQHDVVPLGPSEVAVLREIDSWLEPERLATCRRPVGSERPPVCSTALSRDPSVLNPERFLFATRSFPQIHNLDAPPPYIATYEIPLSPTRGESRDLTLADHSATGCAWRITRAEGVRVEGDLPAAHVRLHSDRGRPGLLVIEKAFGTTACPSETSEMRYPPCVIETRPGDPLQSIVEAD
jgi:hypothetical protein